MKTMNFLLILCTFLLCVLAIEGQQNKYGTGSVFQPKTGSPVDEVIVESSLHIKKRSQVRRTRDVNNFGPLVPGLLRVRRQNRRRQTNPYESSQSSSNAAAQSNFFNPETFGASAANAQAQGFQAKGPLGGFGASAAGTQTQSFTAGKNGVQGSAGASQSQVYKLPNGKTVNVAFSNGFSAGPGGLSNSGSNAVTIN